MSMIDAFHSIGRETIAALALQAAKSERKRAHLLLHAGHDDQVQRLVIAMQPGTYVRPHHHSLQWEMLILLTGGGEVLRFSEDGKLLGRIEMNASAPVVQIRVVMEVKPGPYRPNEFADWAPPEGDPGVLGFMRSRVG
jgi:cupin fold WbuC family metalloprotein